jgi:hypothetical protein
VLVCELVGGFLERTDLVLDRADRGVRVLRGLDRPFLDAGDDGPEALLVGLQVLALAAQRLAVGVGLGELVEHVQPLGQPLLLVGPLGQVVELLLGSADVDEVVLLEAPQAERVGPRALGVLDERRAHGQDVARHLRRRLQAPVAGARHDAHERQHQPESDCQLATDPDVLQHVSSPFV